MIPKYTEEEFNLATSTDKLPLECEECHTLFYRLKPYIKDQRNTVQFCSNKCSCKHRTIKTVICQCVQCGATIHKTTAEFKRCKNNFCSRSCAATYNNTHKTTGNRRSKLEIYLERELPIYFPDLEIHYNQKDAINSELDIYIPSLKLAFELNGIFHYEPIYGIDKLSQIQNNDTRKFQACIEHGIEMCIVDTSGLKYFKPDQAEKYLQIIIGIIHINMSKNS